MFFVTGLIVHTISLTLDRQSPLRNRVIETIRSALDGKCFGCMSPACFLEHIHVFGVSTPAGCKNVIYYQGNNINSSEDSGMEVSVSAWL